jgi:uncharacterized delta-60 repeat protein
VGQRNSRGVLLLVAALMVLAAGSAQAAGPNSGANAGLIQPDGRIVAVGWGEGSGVFGLARFTPKGSLDPSFGAGGKVTGPSSWLTGAGAVALQPDGKIVAAGKDYDGSNFHFTLARYKASGSLDKSFGSGGTVTTAFGLPIAGASAVALQADGKIVAAGQLENGAQAGFVLARFDAGGSLDSTFGTNGRVTTALAGSGPGGVTSALAIQPDGRIVVAGSYAGGFALARYDPDGSLDASFGTGGIVTTPISGLGSGAAAVALQPDGKIVAAGSGNTIGQYNPSFVLIRYDTDGSLDTTFGTNGIASTAFIDPTTCDSCGDEAHAVALQPDGKIVAAGDTCQGRGTCEFALARYNGDGSPDTGFGSDGKVTTGFGPPGGGDHARAVALQADGKMVAVGSARLGKPSHAKFALARYNPDGSLDTSFGQAGKVSASVATCLVPRLYGEALPWAKQALKRGRCVLGKVSRVSSKRVGKGHVVSQHPKACVVPDPKAKIDITVSKGGNGPARRPRHPGAIVYDSRIHLGCGGGGSGGSRIFAIDPSGSSRMQLTGKRNATAPVWSPDGRQIAVGDGSKGDIFVMNANGSHVRLVVKGFAGSPTFSPDGKRIAFSRPASNTIWSVRTSGKKKHKILSNGSSPAWSPDGRRIAFVARDKSGLDIYLASSTGHGRRQLTHVGDATTPVWRPNGRQILVFLAPETGWELAVVNVSNGATRVVARDVNQGARPAWSPDGKRIAYVRYGSASQQLVTIRSTGGGLRVVTNMIGGPNGISWRR